jgi:hypothetical protein
VLQRDLSRSLDVFAEYGGDYPQRGGAMQTIHFGTAYRINSTNQVDFDFGFELSSSTPHSFFACRVFVSRRSPLGQTSARLD